MKSHRIALADVSFANSSNEMVFQNLNLELDASCAIVGKNGSGKSLLFKMISGLVAPLRGGVFIDGKPINYSPYERDPNASKIAIAFQHGGLFDDRACQAHASQEFLKLVGLEGSEKKRPAELSGGMKKRLALAMALEIARPTPDVHPILLLDDPTAGLDPPSSRIIIELIQKVRKDLKFLLLVATTDPIVARELTDEVFYVGMDCTYCHAEWNELRFVTHVECRTFFKGIL